MIIMIQSCRPIQFKLPVPELALRSLCIYLPLPYVKLTTQKECAGMLNAVAMTPHAMPLTCCFIVELDAGRCCGWYGRVACNAGK